MLETDLDNDMVEKFNLALEHKTNNNYKHSIKILLELKESIRKDRNSIDETHFIADIQAQLAEFYMDIGEMDNAMFFFQKSIINNDIVLSKSNRDNLKLVEAQVLNLIDMGILYRAIEKFDKSISSYKKAIEYYDFLISLEPLELKYLEDKSVVLYDIAETYAYLQESSKSLKFINRSEILSQEILNKDRFRVKSINILASLNMIKAQLSTQMDKSTKEIVMFIKIAISYYTLSLNIEPKNIKSLKDKARADMTLADIYSQEYDKTDKALNILKSVIIAYDKALMVNSNDEESIINRANSKSHIGQIYREFGEIYLALEYFNKAIFDYKDSLEIDPLNYELLDNIGVNLNYIANIYMGIKERSIVPKILDKAIGYFNLILEDGFRNDLYSKIIKQNTIYHKALAQIDLSIFHIESGRLDLARATLEDVISNSDAILNSRLDNINYINQKALAINILGDICNIEGKVTRAIDRYKEAISLFNKSLEIKSSDVFTINHRALANSDIVSTYIDINRRDKAYKFFEKAIADYDYGLSLKPNFTDMVINRATLLSNWTYANRAEMRYGEVVKLFEESIRDYNSVLKDNPYHYIAMNNRLTLSSDLAQFHGDNGDRDSAIEILYKECRWYKRSLNIYYNDNITSMNAGVSKLQLANYLIEDKKYKKALNLLKDAITNYDLILDNHKDNIEALSNKSLALREIITLEKNSKFLDQSIDVNLRLLYLYDYYFIGIDEERDTFSLTNRMIYPLSTLIYSYYLGDREDKIDLLKALELSKSKNLKVIMRSETDEKRVNFENKRQKSEFLEIKRELTILKSKIRDIKIEVEAKEEEINSFNGLKNIPTNRIKKVKDELNQKIIERERLYEAFHKESKKLSNLLSIKDFDESSIYSKALSLLSENEVLIYPIYLQEKSEINIVTIIKKGEELVIDIVHEILNYAPNFSKVIFFIQDIKYILSLKDKNLIREKIDIIVKRYKDIDKSIFYTIFEFDKEIDSYNIKVSYKSFVSKYRYTILQNILSSLSGSILKSIPRDIEKIYLLPFGDLNMIPLHAIPIGDNEYLIDRYEISYISSISIWHDLRENRVSSNILERNLFISCDREGESGCLDEAKVCSQYISGEHKNSIDTTTFKNMVHNQKFNILHLSVHGKANLSNPLNSYLSFKNSLLSLLEIHGLRVRANLVILSACETYLSTVEGADEVLAFERAFIIAGATNIISTFDVVDSKRTEEFMLSFYDNLKYSNSLSQCFRETAITDIESNSMEWMMFRFTGF